MNSPRQQQIVAGLLAEGETVIHGRSKNYIVLTRTRAPRAFDSHGRPKPEYWYVGAHGALRAGLNISDSYIVPGAQMRFLTAA